VADAIEAVKREVPLRLDVFDITGAVEVIWELVRSLNKHVEETKPWELAKDEARAAELDQVLYDLADGLRVAAVALSAYLPRTAPRILEALGQSADVAWENVEPGRTVPVEGIGPATPLFPRVDNAPLAAA
jgi:methionyl-tRNA synthetase